MNRRAVLRIGFTLVVVTAIATVGNAMLGAETTATDPSTAFQEGTQAVDPPGATTVITTSQAGNNYLVAFTPDGTVTYYDDEYAFYNEVERVPGTNSIIYVATEHLDRGACEATEPCNRNVVERVNLSTGERELLYERTNPRDRNQWHAIALLDDEGRRIAVGDIAFDRVFVVDTESGIVEWEWDAQTEYDLSSGGVYPGDWTLLNDVEALPDGRLMVSLRNHDQVVFLDPDSGLQENWTLGADDDHTILHEQHNPDYIPATDGEPASGSGAASGSSPAVLVADSENNRIVEYERTAAGDWTQTWEWSDREMRWPRDADRLPNGHTMVVDSNGGRVFELDAENEIVWQVRVSGPYDVERFDVPADRAGVESATALGLESDARQDTDARDEVPEARGVPRNSLGALDGLVPSIVLNGLLYVLPPWFGIRELYATGILGVVTLVWTAAELRWRGYRLRTPIDKREKT